MAVYQISPHVNINDLKDYWTTPNILQKNIIQLMTTHGLRLMNSKIALTE
jgi:hypothetical protein